MKVLVTGGGGALGRHVVDHLARAGHHVRLLLHQDDRVGIERAAQQGFDAELADVCDHAAVDRAVLGRDAVVHLAGVAGIRPSDGPAMLRTNVEGAAAVSAACVHHDARLVHISSASAVGLSRSAVPIEEDFRFPRGGGQHPYPLSKRLGQNIVADAIRRHGLHGVILNPGAVLAPGDPYANAWSALPRLLRSGLRWAPPGGFGFVGRASLLEAVDRGLVVPTSPEPTLVVDQSATYHAVFSLVAREVGVAPPKLVPRSVVRAGLHAAGAVRRMPWLARHVQADGTLDPMLAWPNVYGGARSRHRLGLRQRPLRDAVSDLVHPIPNGAPS